MASAAVKTGRVGIDGTVSPYLCNYLTHEGTWQKLAVGRGLNRTLSFGS